MTDDPRIRELAEIPAVEVISRSAVMLMSAAAEKLGLSEADPDGSPHRDLDEARRLITALAGLVTASAEYLGPHAGPLRDGGPIAIIFSLVCIGLAAFSFLIDFDAADQMIRAGAPEKAAWGIALGLTVTLVWLYLEILRLLSYFQQR